MKIGRVYKIVHNQSDKVYIGSTFNVLRNRFYQHKKQMNGTTGKLFRKYGSDKFTIILVKEYEVCDRKHLFAKEQLWIAKLTNVNMKNAFNPMITQKLKNFREKLNGYERLKKIKYCPCGSTVSLRNFSRHLKTSKHLFFINNINIITS